MRQQTEQSKQTKEKKEAENEVGGEVMGAAESAPKGEASGTAATATEELQKTIKEKDARIKELSVSNFGTLLTRCGIC